MRARLIVESGLASPSVCELTDSPIDLGRHHDNSMVLQDRHASRYHARIFPSKGLWYIRDQATRNGTWLDGQMIRTDTLLCDGQRIAIGDTYLRFSLEVDQPLPAPPSRGTSSTAQQVPSLPEVQQGEELPETALAVDELTTLVRFLNDSLRETAPHRLVRLALGVARDRTGAELVGFLNFDGDDPDFVAVLPARGKVDRPLSQLLTSQVRERKRPVWLCSPQREQLESDSLGQFRDALCLPLQASRLATDPAGDNDVLLGALHLYRSDRAFQEREVRFCEVLATSLASALHALRARRALAADNSRLRVHAGGAGGGRLIGVSQAIRQLREQISTLGDAPCNVLILGESGVGKELVALGLHHSSPRRSGPLITINCASLTASMPESELFGHVKGAFPGAIGDHDGYLSQAEMGTLFLDEIGELSLDLQAKLLRVIETKQFRPVGGRADVNADVRILAATHRDLDQEMREGRFRRELYFRFVVQLEVPPLRKHPEDIPALVEQYVDHLAREYRRRVTLTPEALNRLISYSWPGNVRQLRCVLEAAVARMRGDVCIRACDLALEEVSNEVTVGPNSLDLKEVESWAIRHALAQTGGNNTQAAHVLGIHRDTLLAKLRKYNIEKPGSSPGAS